MRDFVALLILIGTLGLASSACGQADAADDTRPNVLLILADDLGFSDLGCYGGEVPTPNLDRLARGGARFSACYNSARCCPSRASLMTGLHPHQAGIGSFATKEPRRGFGDAYAGYLLPNTATLAEVLRDQGYSTWMVGKWHMGTPGPIERGFDHYYGFKNFHAYSADQWDPSKYARLPTGTKPEVAASNDFFATDVFADYALAFLRQARRPTNSSGRKPWFLYLAHSAPHFPVQAPRESIQKYLPLYRRGWDVLRAERFARLKALGLVAKSAVLPPRSMVPVDREDIANGYSGQRNPAWTDLPEDRREDLAYRMATFAAMVEHIDRGVGRILNTLEQNGELENTLILFTSDNGACYEWGPFGFDGPSRRGETKLHTGDDLAQVGQAGTWHSYGSAWANLGNTPFNLYKHFCHEGGITSPLIAHWPAGSTPRTDWVHDPAHVMDIVPTVLDAVGADFPSQRNGRPVQAVEGTSLLPALRGGILPERALAFEHQRARALRRGRYKVVWGKRMPAKPRWQLFDLATDRTELHDLSTERPERTAELVAEWESWAKRVGAEPFHRPKPNQVRRVPAANKSAPNIVNQPLWLRARVKVDGRASGVILAHGGRQHGYALHLVDGHPVFDVRRSGKVTSLRADEAVTGTITLHARLEADRMRLHIGARELASRPSPGLIQSQPIDGLDVGRDRQTAAGRYEAPNPFSGKILEAEMRTSALSGKRR